ncbi:UDP-N-acetylmuramate--L-alanine ligase [Arsenicibacter rosenii]|uniref:UDP-N-acetylmuramate--L-alanine ligase n=1 Tax=Arsenicibacter rosenii TaxID=1750698 RepID=A0A1S2VEP9_9BACT|nr:UDP-N-acetylmuramate--L-alanine ligase [Arsenicibacter rosenii]OIN57189.1 UDP-N-acetylmuramate--L-alanine ligase [Arsenicibacter rosenii]
MSLDTIKYVYFLGIGGIGMSALARWFGINGFEVAGYDRTPTALTKTLQEEGMSIHFEDDIDLIPEHFLANPHETLIIYTPAIPKTHRELLYLTENGFTLQKRSQVLGLLAGQMRTAGIAGTHGKTTTSSMVAHILRVAQVNSAAFLGGITQNYGTNFLLNEPTEDLKSVVCVVEADEFDRSFLTLYPNIAVVTSTDADHLDIYGDKNAVLESFSAYVSQIEPEGVLFQKKGLLLKDKTKATVYEYSLHEGDYFSKNLRIEDARFVFDLVYPGGVIASIKMIVPGFHNVENAIAAGAVALALGVGPDTICEALSTYRGVKRRFEYIVETDAHVLIDDYAHHPAEVDAFLTSVKALYPDRELTAVFQPHLFTRTRDFAPEFAQSLSIADSVFLLDIYPARELPIEGVTSNIIFAEITAEKKQLCSKKELLTIVKSEKPSLLVTIGAGDIDQMLPDLKDILTSQ